MKIIKEYHEKDAGYGKNRYLIRISCKGSNEDYFAPFINLDTLPGTIPGSFNIHKLTSREFLQDNSIEYQTKIVDDTEMIIPTGIVDFVNQENYFLKYLNLKCESYDNLHQVTQTIDLIEEAIKIKYEAIRLIRKAKSLEVEVTEVVD
jgi:hypothetical protein